MASDFDNPGSKPHHHWPEFEGLSMSRRDVLYRLARTPREARGRVVRGVQFVGLLAWGFLVFVASAVLLDFLNAKRVADLPALLLLVAVMGIGFLSLRGIWRFILRREVRRLRTLDLCPCGYGLREVVPLPNTDPLMVRCPECGWHTEAADLTTHASVPKTPS
ncbi:MAG: hypothetical protein SFY96_14680 [Planctomycetota bacterium]|nr:hypothetical protein [Planctomycetota bacterium]